MRSFSSSETMDSKCGDRGGESNQNKVRSARTRLRLELQKLKPNSENIRSICAQELGGEIPREVRSEVWLSLLGVETNDRFLLDDCIRGTKLDLHNQRVIRVDTDRTRAGIALFRTDEMKALVSKILTYYCKSQGIKYKQGLNEVLAPFILLRNEPRLPDGIIFNMYCAFISRFIPHVFSDEDFKALQCEFRIFRLLVQYHDPEICHRLDQYQLVPELYATPWFLTLFARNVSIDLLFKIWDTYLLEARQEGPVLHMFACLALLLSNREVILRAHSSDLPMFLTSVLGAASTGRKDGPSEKQEDEEKEILKMLGLDSSSSLQIVTLSNASQVNFIFDLARALKASTPKSLASLVKMSLLSATSPSSEDLDKLEKTHCLTISPVEIAKLLKYDRRASHNGNDLSLVENKSFDVLVLDCRSKQEYEASHMSQSIHFDPRLLSAPEQLDHAMKVIEQLGKGISGKSHEKHYVIIGGSNGEKETKISTMLILHLLQRDFKHVSIVEGSWHSLRKLMKSNLRVGQSKIKIYSETNLRKVSQKHSGIDDADSWLQKLKSGVERSRISEKLQSISVSTVATSKAWFAGIESLGEKSKKEEGAADSGIRMGDIAARFGGWMQSFKEGSGDIPKSTNVQSEQDALKRTESPEVIYR